MYMSVCIDIGKGFQYLRCVYECICMCMCAYVGIYVDMCVTRHAYVWLLSHLIYMRYVNINSN